MRSGFRPSVGDKEWLGDGVYFFEDNVSMACFWARAHGCLNGEVGVIAARISCDEDHIILVCRRKGPPRAGTGWLPAIGMDAGARALSLACSHITGHFPDWNHLLVFDPAVGIVGFRSGFFADTSRLQGKSVDGCDRLGSSNR